MKKESLQKEFNYKGFANELFALYSQNSYGSFSKKEMDLFLFDKFKEMGKIQSESSWDLAKELKITKNKAQALLYESVIRYHSQNEVERIRDALNEIPQSLDKGIFSLIVDDRYAREGMRNFLAKCGYVTDLSFASDVVKVPTEAYWALLEKYNSDVAKKLKKELFIKDLKSLGKDAFSGILSKFAGEVFGQTVDRTVSSFFKFLQNNKENLQHEDNT